jgi:hypothetical protein
MRNVGAAMTAPNDTVTISLTELVRLTEFWRTLAELAEQEAESVPVCYGRGFEEGRSHAFNTAARELDAVIKTWAQP